MEQNQIAELRELVEFLKANGIAKFELERPEYKVRLEFTGATPPPAPTVALSPIAHLMPAVTAGDASAAGTPSPLASEPALAAAAAPAPENLHEVRSPIVGTFYESPSPGAAPFVKVGDQVEAGQVLCIVEAMKLMNEVEADIAGEVVQRIAVSGQPVEYGQALFSIRPR